MQYEVQNNASFRVDEDSGPELMANFVAEIVQETRIVDGMSTKTVLRIKGQRQETPDVGDENQDADRNEPKLIVFPEVEVTAEEYASMNWVMSNWGVKAIIRPGSGIRDDLRTFIQLRSKPKVTTIYRHTGWTKIGGKEVYLHAGGGIKKTGNDKSIQVRLPAELSKYDLSCDAPEKDSVQASLELVNLSKKEITWPLLAATVAPMYGPVDFAIHLAGRTGTYKSECISLYQSHYGCKMDARNLPGSWSSTANALEAQAFMACNAPFVIDDFVPQGSAWQVRSYQMNADKIIRAQGNQAGRARLTDVSSLQQTMYPRGIILSTGEDVPEGHSVRARMLILELSPGDVNTNALSNAQKKRELLPGAIAGFAKHLADGGVSLRTKCDELRDKYRGIGHTRTPGMLARLVCSIEGYLEYANMIGVIDVKAMSRLRAESQKAIEEAGGRQQSYLEDVDPVDIVMNSIRHAFGAGLGHLRSMNGGVPSNAAIVGWSEERSAGELPTFKSRGPCIGWVSVIDNDLFLDITTGLSVIKKIAGAELALTKQTLLKRMKDAGVLTRVDDARQRNTTRVTADGHVRQVLALSLSDVLDTSDGGSKDE